MALHPARLVGLAAVLLVTALSLVAVTLRLKLDPNVSALLPDRGDAAALRRYVRAFGGGDLAIVMIKGNDPDENATVAAEIAEALTKRPSVKKAVDRLESSETLDPMLAFRHADARARARLAQALSPEGMRARLAETKALLLSPGGGAATEMVAADPLRLTQLVFEGADIGTGVRTQPDGAFANDDGTMHLVLAQPKGQALRGEDARAFVTDAHAVLDPIGKARPNVTLGLTGGHAIAAATEVMLNRDLALSSTVAMVLASAVFAMVFRRLRALFAVMPPLILGTLWTAGVAATLPGGLSAIAVAFMSVVVGVGVDTGVHVYAALLEARRQGYCPADAARMARSHSARPVLLAATTAAAAFGALVLSDIHAVQQLGILCAAGELFTAVAILLVTPMVGAILEKTPPPAATAPRWTQLVAWLTGTRPRAAVCSLLAITPMAAIALGAGPPLAEAIIAIRPRELAPLKVQQQVFETFGGRRGQWVVLVADADKDRAHLRADRIAEALAAMKDDVEAVDALTALAPAEQTQSERFSARDALDMPAKATELLAALKDTGFAPERFSAVLEGMRHPSHQKVSIADLEGTAAEILLSRYSGADQREHLTAIYVRPREVSGATVRIEEAIRTVDPGAMLTGYSRLESSLRQSLSHDLPRIGLVAMILVVIALAASLRRARDVVLAGVVVVAEIAAVLLVIRVLGIPLHAYDALVLPVLLGITVDEGIFLLYRSRSSAEGDIIGDTLRHEGPAVAATALTTAAGFAALGLCDFDGLRHLGWVGAIGSVTGLLLAFIVVPAGLRLWGLKTSPARSSQNRGNPG